MISVGLYISSTIIGAFGAWFVARFAVGMGLLDHPGDRSSHSVPTPKGGGIGILAAFVLVSVHISLPLFFWVTVVFIALIGFLADIYDLSPNARLLFQFASGGIVSAGALSSQLSHLNGLLIVLAVLSVIYIVGTANFYNFMDGIDGIATVTGIIGFGLLANYGIKSGGDPKLITISFCIVFACVGFLPFNIPKAKVFMGDVGSILLGFVFACMVISFTHSFSDFIILTCFMFPFYIDELLTMLERIVDKQGLSIPHRRHFYQVLVNEGRIEHWKVSIGYGISQLTVGLIIWVLISHNLFIGILGVFTFIILFFIVNMKVKKKYGCWIG